MRWLAFLVLAAVVAGQTLVDRDANPEEWLSYGADYAETRYSALDQIDVSNVSKVGLAWVMDAGSYEGVWAEATLLMQDGVLYGTVGWNVTFAADAATGALKWRWDSQVAGVESPRRAVNRGVAIYGGKVYESLFDGRVVALDAETGKVVWSVLDGVAGSGIRLMPAVRVVKGKVIVGSGRVTAYDAETGERVWRFDAAPGEIGNGFAYDAQADILYAAAGGGSLVGLKPDSGKLVWSRKADAGGADVQMLLLDVAIQGRKRNVIVESRYAEVAVIDRITGQLIHTLRAGAGDGAGGVPMSYSPLTGLVYLSTGDGLAAYDPVANKVKWVGPAGNSGSVATAGNLVFDFRFAYNATTGERVWDRPELHNAGGWMTYLLRGKQYVAVMGRTEGKQYVYAFALDGTAQVP